MSHPAEDAYYNADRMGGEWEQAADKAIKKLAKSGRQFTADDFRQLMQDVPEPHSKNAVGGLFKAWCSRGVIHVVGYDTSKATSRNGGLIRVWQGNTAA